MGSSIERNVLSTLTLYLTDLIAISILVFALYFPRHRRRDMVVAYLVVNVGVLAVTDALAASTIAAGLGLGLFGILSIIRLRSSELDQAEVAYYFAALALGLLAGLSATPSWLAPALMGVILAALWIGDHPSMFAGYRTQQVVLERAYPDERALVAALESMLGGRVYNVKVRNLDMVRDTTSVEVRYRVDSRTGRGAAPRVEENAWS